MKKKILLLLVMLTVLAATVISFGDDIEFSKAEFLKEVILVAEIEIQEDIESDFVDSINSEYIPYLEAAYRKDIISEDERLNIDKIITKEEAVVILVKVFGERMQVKNITEEMIEEEMDFTDNQSISPLIKPYITYAIKNDMIKDSRRSFYPLMPLNEEKAKDMIEKAKEAHDKYFTRKGLSAGEILELAGKNIEKLDNFKAIGKLEMNMSMKIEGFPAEDDFEQQILDDGMNMNMFIDMDMQIENPHRNYIKQTVRTNSNGIDLEDQSEVFTDESAKYQKTALTGDKWIKTDMDSVMNQIQSLQGNNPQDMAQLSREEMEFFKNYSWYGENEEIDGIEYYTINVYIDKDSYKKFFKEYVQQIIDASLEEQQELSTIEGVDEAEIEMSKMMAKQIIEQMDVEIHSKYYINKKTMNYEKAEIMQNMYMDMSNLMQTFAAMSEEDDVDLTNVKFEMLTKMEGTFDYFDFDGEVAFPEITEEDIIELGNIMLP